MASVMLISENEREMQILKLAFEQKSIKVSSCTADYSNYIKILQYLPDIIFLEIPRISHTQIHFTEMIKAHKKTKFTPIVGYGDKVDDAVKKGFLDKGILYYITRPLKISVILDVFQKNLKYLNKEMALPKEAPADKGKDIELILGKEAPGSKKIEVMTSYIVKLLAFPFTVAKVLQLAESEKSAAVDLAKVIQADPVISAQLLKISNSVLFASVNRRIGSVKDAIIRVGFKETRRLVMSMSVMKLFGETSNNVGLDRKAFWFHSLVCGIIAERLARQMGTVNTEEAFLAGILHDFGILLLDEFFPPVFARVLSDAADKKTQFILAERELLGITHNDVVTDLFSKWKLPDAVTEGIIGQYQFGGYKDNLDTPAKKISLCVGVSDILAKTVGLGSECDRFICPVANWAFDSVRMPAGVTPAFLDDVNHQITLYREFLKLDKSDTGRAAREKTCDGKSPVGVINQARDVFVPPVLYLSSEECEPVMHKLDSPKIEADGVVIWADATITAEAIEQVAKAAAKPQRASGTAPGTGVPVIVLTDEGAPVLSRRGELARVTFLSRSFDLRYLDVHCGEGATTGSGTTETFPGPNAKEVSLGKTADAGKKSFSAIGAEAAAVGRGS
jgi:HD-like signal output (HDOD) protein